jgi:hypothetical protein
MDLQKVVDLAAAVGASGAVMTARVFSLQVPEPDAQQMDFVKWALKEGGMFVVVLVVLYFYRRDFRTSSQHQQAQSSALLQVVQGNVAAMQKLEATTARLARAQEQNARHGNRMDG